MIADALLFADPPPRVREPLDLADVVAEGSSTRGRARAGTPRTPAAGRTFDLAPAPAGGAADPDAARRCVVAALGRNAVEAGASPGAISRPKA